MKERQLLIENTKMDKEYLLEMEDANNLKKYIENPDIPIYMVGLLQKGDTPNRNRRIYPFDILKPECDRYLGEEIKELQSYGELDHPAQSAVPELKNTAHTIEDLWYKGVEVWGRIKVLNAFMPQNAPGLIARGIVLNKKKLGISSRALGSVYQDGSGYDVVDNDLEIICWDLVSRPSTIGANMKVATDNEVGKGLQKESKLLNECKNLDGKELKAILKESRLQNLSGEEKLYLDILGVEKFIQLKYGR